MGWTTKGRSVVAAEVAERWAACRALVGCECDEVRANGAVAHRKGCPTWVSRGKGWTETGRSLAAVYGRLGAEARWRGVDSAERSEIMKEVAKAKRKKWTYARRTAARNRVAALRRRQRLGQEPISAKQARLLCDFGMWPRKKS